jgi:hypothetical protein
VRVPVRVSVIALVAALSAILAPSAQAAGAPPQIADSWAAGVGGAVVDLHALVNPNELETRVRAEYLTAEAYEANLTATPPVDGFTGAVVSPAGGLAIGAGSTPAEFSRHIGGLKPATAYRYRIVATNSAGTTTGPVGGFITRPSASPTFELPDGRGWEMVSPVDKNGGDIQGAGAYFGGGVLQAAADGNSVTYDSAFSFARGQGAPGVSQYISRRGSQGWATENVTTPTDAGAYSLESDGVPFQLFSGDLARGLVFDPQRCATAPCPRDYLLRQSSNGALATSAQTDDLAFAGATPDLAHVVLSTCVALTADATEAAGVGGCDVSKPNLYDWSGGDLTLINVLPGDTHGTPGATLGAQGGAISADGSRVYFSVGGNLYLRHGAATSPVDAGQGGGASFETASADGSVALFTKAGHLYRYSASGGAAQDLTPGGGVEGVLGASPDGSFVYYVTSAGLFLSHGGGGPVKVAAGAGPSDYPPSQGTARVAADGTLAFLSSASLTGSDDGGFAEVYRYSPADGTLLCVSCNPTGARPLGPSTIPGATVNGASPAATRVYKPRALSADGNRILFDSRDSLVTTDTNNDRDVYEWEEQGEGTCAEAGGCLALISSGRSTEGASFIDASADGSDVFFLTDGSLVPGDPGAEDVYDARVGGGFAVPSPPIDCVGDACQVLPGEPEDPAPGTASIGPEVNPPVKFPKHKTHHRRKKHRHRKHRHRHHRRHHHPKGGRS